MGRIIAIDYGRKRTGLAVSDRMRLIAGALATLPGDKVIEFLRDYISKEPVELFVLGEPKQMNNQPSENMQWVTIFKTQLQKAFPEIEIEMVDERFTSVLAHRAMLDGGLKKKDRRNKELVDRLSATIILQTYLETNRI
ncbi:MAG: Holliday junction resolvase RuvX [Dysgonamonadaceae bacterium]|jgi:putative Holliday junction resolvase|nr:Holliday junction resolvase RuvX [Dysgonamonadaceae bacterium]